MTEWKSSETIIHYCPDTSKLGPSNIKTYQSACTYSNGEPRYFMPRVMATDPAEVNCLDCLDVIHGKVKNNAP